MTVPFDTRLRQLAQELTDAAPLPPSWDEVPVAQIEVAEPSPRNRRLTAILASAAIVGLVVAGIALTRDRSHTSSVRSPAPSAPSIGSESTVSTTSTATSTSVVSASPTIAVSYTAPPPMLELQPFATVDVPPGSSGPQSIPPIAALDGGRAAVIDLDGGEVIVVEPYIGGLQQHIPLETTPGPFMVNGDHDVLYGIAQRGDESNPAAAEIVAIALTGPRAGSEIAAVSVSILPYTEAGRTMLGDGRDGIIDRRTGEQLLPYVGTDGSPKGYDEAPPNYRLDENGIVTDMNGSGRWNLTIERDPNYRGMYDTEPPPAPIGYGRAIYWTALGPAADPTLDVSDPTLPVIAVLQADGTGAWYGIPDGWIVVASDLEGVVFARRLGDNIELATLPP